jgi:hypothetical protein
MTSSIDRPSTGEPSEDAAYLPSSDEENEPDDEATDKSLVIEDPDGDDMMHEEKKEHSPLAQFAAAGAADIGAENRYKAMPLHRAKLEGKTLTRVWRKVTAYCDTVPLDAGGETLGEDVDGCINKVGLVQGVLEPLKKYKFVGEFGHGCGVTAMLLATRHVIFGWEIVPSRHEYSQQLLAQCKGWTRSLNHVELGSSHHYHHPHHRLHPALPFSLECRNLNSLITPEMAKRYAGQPIEEWLLRGCRGLFQCAVLTRLLM